MVFVDLTASDQDAAREYLVVREILEPVDRNSAEHGVPAAGDRSSYATDNHEIDYGNHANMMTTTMATKAKPVTFPPSRISSRGAIRSLEEVAASASRLPHRKR